MSSDKARRAKTTVRIRFPINPRVKQTGQFSVFCTLSDDILISSAEVELFSRLLTPSGDQPAPELVTNDNGASTGNSADAN